ncbi:MAG: AbgT family transporter [Planctomycetes bacterium]|nr:AbgT family transporter [Planctomycetota bacterium]
MLNFVERVGNRLPDQVTIFAVLAGVVLLLSYFGERAGVSAQNPITGERIQVSNLLTRQGVQSLLTEMVRNFKDFPPLGMVLAALIGVGVADKSGLFAALLKGTVALMPHWLLTPTIVFVGIMSNVALDAGFVILPPLAAMAFAAVGRHPMAGVAAAIAGVAGGFSANLLITTLDPLLAGLTASAANALDPAYPPVNAACNWYFLIASTILLTLVGWLVSAKIVEPRLGRWAGTSDTIVPEHRLSRAEARGLLAAGVALVVVILGILALTLPENAVLRSADKNAGGVESLRPFFDSMVVLILVGFLVPGIAYGVVNGTVRSDKDVAGMMAASLSTMGAYIAMAFFASQFIAWFNKSNLGGLVAFQGAAFLKSIGLSGLPLGVAFVTGVAIFNILIASASAKWTLLAPVFVPMLMLMGFSPEATQALYRVGDSVTNPITPLNAYWPVVLATIHRYLPRAGLGTLISATLPYSIAFYLTWMAMIVLWLLCEWPLGLGAPLHYPLGQ